MAGHASSIELEFTRRWTELRGDSSFKAVTWKQSYQDLAVLSIAVMPCGYDCSNHLELQMNTDEHG